MTEYQIPGRVPDDTTPPDAVSDYWRERNTAERDAPAAETSTSQPTGDALRHQLLLIPTQRKYDDHTKPCRECSQKPNRILRKAKPLHKVSALP